MSQFPDLKSQNFPKSLIVVAILFFFLPSLFVIVDAGHVGIVKRLGAVNEVALKEGFHLKLPFVDTVIEMNVRLVRDFHV